MLVQSFLITIYNKKIILVPNSSTLSTNDNYLEQIQKNIHLNSVVDNVLFSIIILMKNVMCVHFNEIFFSPFQSS
jgi:hypothetical protein